MRMGSRGMALRTMAWLVAAAFVVAGCGGQSAPASNPPKPAEQPAASKRPATMAELAAYTGADREQILVEGAKKEGALLVYTSMPQPDMQAVTDAFTAKYGVTVNVWRGKSEEVLQRVVAEVKAKKFDVDLVETNGPELELLTREKLTQVIASPHHADLVKGALASHKGWVATRLNMFVQAYNPKLVKKEELPKTWDGFLDPKWKGKLVVENEDWDWFAGLVTHLGEEKGLKLFKDIMATNGIGLRKGHTLATEMVGAGEVPVMLTAYSYAADQIKAKGAPIDWYAIAPAFVRPNGAAALAGAPHPHAALLFYDFLLSGGQEVMVKRNMVVSNTRVDATAKNTPMQFIDPSVVLDAGKKWPDLWDQIVLKGAKK